MTMTMTMTSTVMVVMTTMTMCTFAQLPWPNELAPIKTVYQPVNRDAYEQQCIVKGPPLDLMFVVDFSSSTREVYPRYLNLVKEIFKLVAVGPESTRAAMVTFSSRAIVRFPFNAYTREQEYLDYMDQLIDTKTQRSTSRLDLGLFEAYKLFDEQYGMRPKREGVKRMLIIMSDGRSTHSPKLGDVDYQNATRLRDDKDVEIYAFALTNNKETISADQLRTYISGRKDAGFDRYITNNNETAAYDWYTPFAGVEICEEIPKCEPGAHKPVDITMVLDLSGSVEDRETSAFNFVRRALNTVHLSQEATKISLITYSNTAQVKVSFKDSASANRAEMLAVLNELERCTQEGSCVSAGGATNTHEGLRRAYGLYGGDNGAREVNSKGNQVKRLVILVSDGKSTSHSRAMSEANRLIQLRNATIFGVALGDSGDDTDLGQLAELAGNRLSHVFLSNQRVFSAAVGECRGGQAITTCMLAFEEVMLEKITDKSCPDLNVTDASVKENAKPVQIFPQEWTCSESGVQATLRFTNGFGGSIAVAGHETNFACRITGDGKKKEVELNVRNGNCGMKLEAIKNTTKVKKSFLLRIRYHQYVDTKFDQLVPVTCEVDDRETHTALTKQTADAPQQLVLPDPKLATCTYQITPTQNGQRNCEVLDASVGTRLNHTWSCKGLSADQSIFVHDCVADADDGNTTILSLLNHDGCEGDQYLMRTPRYNHGRGAARHTVSVLAFAFKFPTDTIVRYRCMISICDHGKPLGNCQRTFKKLGPGRVDPYPDRCVTHPLSEKPVIAQDELPPYDTPPLKSGFDHTVSVRARRINMYVKEQFDYDGKPNNNFCRLR